MSGKLRSDCFQEPSNKPQNMVFQQGTIQQEMGRENDDGKKNIFPIIYIENAQCLTV